MIVHIVVFRLSAEDPATKLRDASEFGARLAALEGRVTGLLSVEVGIDVGLLRDHADMVLTSKHVSYADLEAYQAHPLHVQAATFGRTVVAERTTVDYEIVAPG